MEWDESDLSSESSADVTANSSGECCTPKERVTQISLEAVAKQFGEMNTVSPKTRWLSSCSGALSSGSQHRLRHGAKGRVLFAEQVKEKISTKWSDQEVYALILFMMFHTDGQTWVTHKQSKFWEDAAKFVQQHSKSANCRTG